MKKITWKRITSVLITTAVIFVMLVSATAAQLLSPKEVASHMENEKLAKAFEGKNAVKVNKTASSGGYNFTLLGMISGKGLRDVQDINQDRTYFAVAIARDDGSKMPDTMDKDYGKVPFFISPLIKGQKPWQVNIASMDGGIHCFCRRWGYVQADRM
ncbi:MAG TPA: DUF4179 domain-containing protein [Ruminiclostridium sp.]|nr:DUF4179 domain-containing protein [Ruminiclostridium sp.]